MIMLSSTPPIFAFHFVLTVLVSSSYVTPTKLWIRRSHHHHICHQKASSKGRGAIFIVADHYCVGYSFQQQAAQIPPPPDTYFVFFFLFLFNSGRKKTSCCLFSLLLLLRSFCHASRPMSQVKSHVKQMCKQQQHREDMENKRIGVTSEWGLINRRLTESREEEEASSNTVVCCACTYRYTQYICSCQPTIYFMDASLRRSWMNEWIQASYKQTTTINASLNHLLTWTWVV